MSEVMATDIREVNRQHLLGDALRRVLVKSGMLGEDAEPTGPELLAAADAFCEEPVKAEDSDGGSHMLKVAGKSFRCECMCNVFTKFGDHRYRCNACGATYTGE